MKKYKDMNGLGFMNKKYKIKKSKALIKCKEMNLVYKLMNKFRKKSFLKKIKKYLIIV